MRSCPLPRYSLRSLFAAVSIFCVGLAIFVHRASQQRNAVALVKSFGGRVAYDCDDDESPNHWWSHWLCGILGKDYGGTVETVSLYDTNVKDKDLAFAR